MKLCVILAALALQCVTSHRKHDDCNTQQSEVKFNLKSRNASIWFSHQSNEKNYTTTIAQSIKKYLAPPNRSLYQWSLRTDQIKKKHIWDFLIKFVGTPSWNTFENFIQASAWWHICVCLNNHPLSKATESVWFIHEPLELWHLLFKQLESSGDPVVSSRSLGTLDTYGFRFLFYHTIVDHNTIVMRFVYSFMTSTVW